MKNRILQYSSINFYIKMLVKNTLIKIQIHKIYILKFGGDLMGIFTLCISLSIITF